MPRGTPKYSLIVDQILRDIRNGVYPVGAALPTETALMRAYDVSRYTVRSAIHVLRNQGIVSSRQGQGTRVVSTGSKAALVEHIQSVDELIKFGQARRRTMLNHSVVEADEELAELFGTQPGRRLLEIHMLRHGAGQDTPAIAYLVLWMDALFEPILEDLEPVEDLEPQQKSVAELLFERFSISVGAVRQTVSATTLSADTAEILFRNEHDAALVIDRRYYQQPDAPAYLRARSICAADSFQIESFFQSTAGKGAHLS